MNTLLALVAATAILVAMPGPNVALIVANTLHYGARTGIVTVLGTTAGVAVQLLVVVLGLSAVVMIVAEALTWIRWLGVAYLVWLGITTWRRRADDLGEVVAVPAIFWRGALVAAINPKTLLFNAAFIPQFVAEAALAPLTVAAAVFLGVLFAGDLLWVAFADSARRFLARYAVWRNRLTGAFLTAAGIGLALARK